MRPLLSGLIPALLPVAILLAACRPGQPCLSCDEDEDDDLAEVPDVSDPDLPCDGADLQTDDANCGECGAACWPRGQGEYQADGCVDGACGPDWYGKIWLEQSELTCADVCAEASLPCQANACADLTGFVCDSVIDVQCGTLTTGNAPLVEIVGACTDPIEWPIETTWDHRYVYCCCG